MTNFNKILVGFGILLLCARLGNSLECYVCENQDDNREKCLNSIHPCEQGQDVCMTTVKWGTKPYWQQGADKQYYVSKKCETKSNCEKTRARSMQYCSYIWYEDWKCVHCCQGDRCNYYVILGASSTHVSIAVVFTGCLISVLRYVLSS